MEEGPFLGKFTQALRGSNLSISMKTPIAVNMSSEQVRLVTVEPNPFTTTFRVHIQSQFYEMGYLNLIDQLGTSVFSAEFNLVPGMNEQACDPGIVAEGYYYLHYKTKESGIFVVHQMYHSH